MDRERFLDLESGVSEFKSTRNYFVKGASRVFLWRFTQLFKAHRGQQDYHPWLGQLGIMAKVSLELGRPVCEKSFRGRWNKTRRSCKCW